MIIKNKKTGEDRAFWAHCEAVAAEVKSWPAWMRGETGSGDASKGCPCVFCMRDAVKK
jgi:hypothetical protein